jgi:hypothetical protein
MPSYRRVLVRFVQPIVAPGGAGVPSCKYFPGNVAGLRADFVDDIVRRGLGFYVDQGGDG